MTSTVDWHPIQQDPAFLGTYLLSRASHGAHEAYWDGDHWGDLDGDGCPSYTDGDHWAYLPSPAGAERSAKIPESGCTVTTPDPSSLSPNQTAALLEELARQVTRFATLLAHPPLQVPLDDPTYTTRRSASGRSPELEVQPAPGRLWGSGTVHPPFSGWYLTMMAFKSYRPLFYSRPSGRWYATRAVSHPARSPIFWHSHTLPDSMVPTNALKGDRT